MKDNKIIIVGGGSAGYLTALILKQKFQEKINIKIIKSSAIGIIGVGEGSTEHWSDFLSFVKIDKELMVKECGATYKFGIMFKEWQDKNYLHSVDKDFDITLGQEHICFLNLILNNKKLNHEFLYENRLPQDCPPNQFHFAPNLLINNFLNPVQSIKKSATYFLFLLVI